MKHLYKISILLLLALLMPAIVLAKPQNHQRMINNRGLKDLSGSVIFDIQYAPESMGHFTRVQSAHVRYSGNEDVTMHARVYRYFGDVVELQAIHGNEMYPSISNYTDGNTLEITVCAEGYNDLIETIGFHNDYVESHSKYISSYCVGSLESGNCYVLYGDLTYSYTKTDYRYYHDGFEVFHDYMLIDAFREYAGDITIPSSVTTIGDYAFNVYEGEYLLTGKTPPFNYYYVYLPSMPFYEAVLRVPSSIQTIEKNAFSNPPYAESYGRPYTFSNVIIESLASWCSINFNGSGCNPLLYTTKFSIENNTVQNLVIPDTIPVINSYAFAGCHGVNSITLPISVVFGNQVFLGSSVQSLMLTGEGAFQEGSLDMTAANVYIDEGITEIEGILVKPTDVYCYSNTPPICDDNTFTDYSGTLHVPAGALAAYFTAPFWCNFINIVGDAIEPKSLSINHDSISMRTGMMQQLVAVVSPTNAAGTITWDSSNNNVASVENGLVTAIAPGECDIIVNCFDIQAICHVLVTEIKPSSITLSQESALMETGTQLTLSATVLPDSTTYKDVEWSSSDVSVATVDNGVVTAISPGECDIIAKCQSIQAICHVTVSEIMPEAVILDKDSAIIETGMQVALTATVLPDSASNKIVTWSSTDVDIATVNNGIVTAIQPGECDIIAKCQNIQAICHVTVIGVQPKSITLSQESILMKVNKKYELIATVLPDSAVNKTVTWSSTDESIAIVNDGVVTAVGTGECDIIANCQDLQAICHITVIQFSINQHQAELLPNHIYVLLPTSTPVFPEMTVISSNPTVAAARISNNVIQVVGIKEGESTIIIYSSYGHAILDSCIVEVYTERGDVNCDGFVNISDATSLIDALLDGSNVYSTENADCNNDGNVTITDLTMLIDALLGGAALPDKDSEIITVNGVSFKMVKVPGGTFTMGGTAGQGDQTYDDEFPLHEVTLSSFSIGETEVTQALWQAVMGSNPSNFTGDLNRPVEMVNWSDCQTFIAKLNQMTGMSFRLPTEAEWEYAARGGKKSHDYMFAGSNDLDEVAWAITNIPSQQPNTPSYGTQPVAQKTPNELGLYDMSGNTINAF